MSQYKWTKGNLQFTTGWDRPLRYFFLMIETIPDPKDDVESYAFNNLDRPDPGMDIAEIRGVCRAHGSDLPAEIEASMIKDAIDGG